MTRTSVHGILVATSALLRFGVRRGVIESNPTRAHRSRIPGVGDTLVFRTANDKPQDRHNVGRALRTAGDAAGLNPNGAKKVSPHDLRHSCAALLLAASVPAPKVAAILRHTDARTTLTFYAGLVESQRCELRSDLEAALRD